MLCCEFPIRDEDQGGTVEKNTLEGFEDKGDRCSYTEEETCLQENG